jgi:serine/threonine protein kinase
MKGGFLKGQGTYGCVFKPALLCRGSKTPTDPNKVGKITSYEDAKNELKIGKYLRGIAGYENYVIPAESESCIPRAKSRQVDKDIDKCQFSEKLQLNTTIQIIMPWGGYSLNRINLDPIGFNFFKFMEDVLAGGTFLILNDLCHFDISSLNILTNNNKQVRFIDFGFSFRPSQLNLEILNLRWREIDFYYDTETPEITLMLTLHRNNNVEEAIKQLKENKPAVKLLQLICGISPDAWANDLREWVKTSQSFQEHNWLNCWKTYWPGFDAWGIGAMLLNILEIQLRFDTFINSEQWKMKGTIIKSILSNLCRSHPGKRIDAAEALALLTNGAHPLIAFRPFMHVLNAGSDNSAVVVNGYQWIREKQKVRKDVFS